MRTTRILLPIFLLFVSIACWAQDTISPCEKSLAEAVKVYQAYNYAGAIPLFERTLKLCRDNKGFTEDDKYSVMALLSMSYYEAGREDSAISIGEPARAYYAKMKSGWPYFYFDMLSRLAMSYSYFGEYQKAIDAYDIVLPFYAARKGMNSEFFMWHAIQQATCYASLGDFVTAGYLYRNLRNLLQTYGAAESDMYTAVITNMGNDFTRQGYYDSAFMFQRQSLSLREKLFGKRHLEYAKGLNNLAFVYSATGDYASAINLYESSRNIYENDSAGASLDYAGVLTNLGNAYSKLDQYQHASDLHIKSLKIVKSIVGDYHVRVAQGIQDIAMDYVGTGGEKNIKDAIGFYRYAFSIMNRIKADQTFDAAVLLSNLGDAYRYTTRGDSSLYFLNESLALRQKLNRINNESYSILLGHMGDAYSDMQLYDKAVPYYIESMSILKKLFGEDFPSYSTALSNLAQVFLKKGDLMKGDSLLQAAYQLDKKYILQNTEGLSEDEKESFAIVIRAFNAVGLSSREHNAGILKSDWIYNSILFEKGLLLEGAKGLSGFFKQITDNDLRQKANEFILLKTIIGRELVKPAGSRRKDLDDLQNNATNLERQLLLASAGYRDWKDQFDTDWKTLQNKLTDGEAAIEFVAYRRMREKYFDSTSQYVALVIKKGMKEPLVIPLFSDEEISKLVSRSSSQEAVVKKLYRSTIKTTTTQALPSDSLYHLLWKPLAAQLQDTRTIYFSADGIINNLNLAAIITPAGKRLVEDYEFIQLSSTRNIMKPATMPVFKEMQLWGGINYNGKSTTASNRSATFAYLPGTLSEINDIASSAHNNQRNIKSVVAMDASEDAFKQLSGRSPEVLHIATHGFFFPDASKAARHDENRFANASNPLLRSGLALANANINWSEGLITSDKEDGILTAYEIANLDLSNTKLVVLSACETGLGDIKSGEGVYGLQRAFKLAGVNYLIMSLWQVPDMETKEFMQTFYANCFAGMPVRKAFRETQLAMNKKYQPYQWAAFVLVE